jgi:hypothetical protein
MSTEIFPEAEQQDPTGLTALVGDSPTVKFGDEEVTARKFRLKQFKQVFALVYELRSAFNFRTGAFDVSKAMAEGEAKVYKLVELSSGKDKKWFEAKDDDIEAGVGEEFVELAIQVIRVNFDTIGKKIFRAVAYFTEGVEEATAQTAHGLM